MTSKTICVVGGSGFVGRHLVALLARRGYRVIVPANRRESAKDLAVMPSVEVVQANVHDAAVMQELLRGVDAVINLVGLLHETAAGQVDSPRTQRGSFHYAHVELPRKIIQACLFAGVPRDHAYIRKIKPDHGTIGYLFNIPLDALPYCLAGGPWSRDC